MSYNGSEWRKCDLHFHTPSSYDYADKSVTNEQIIEKLIENNVSIVAVTDHHTIDIDRINSLSHIANGRLTVLPGIEFLSDAKGKDPIHFIGIFPEATKCNLPFIWKQLESRTAIKKMEGEGKQANEVYCDLTETIALIKELGGIVTIHAGDKSNSVENITHSLPHGEAQKTDIALAVDIFELGKETDQNGYRKFVFPAIKKIIPMIICSDNHNVNKYTLKQNCWIKADPTFEGLKQVIYEPSRVYIGENKPQSALHKLEEVLLNFDENTLWGNDKFCFANFNEPLKFSPYLSCIIGGRGSGKSTLLNLIAEKIGKGNKNFFSKLNEKSIASKVEFIPNVIENIEYLAQNEIEEFAKDSTQFTQAIFERLDKKSNNHLSRIQNEITSKLKIYDNQIDKLLLHFEKTKILENKKNDLNKIEYLLKTFMDDDFNTNYSAMNIVLQEKNTRLKWKTNYQNSLRELSEIIRKIEFDFIEKDESPGSWTNDNGYKDAQKNLNDELIAIHKKYQEMDFQLDTKKLFEVEEQINNYKNTIDVYLQERGYSLENLNDLKNALSNRTTVQNEIKELEAEIEQINNDITAFSSVDIDESIYKFGCDINNEIVQINQLFFEISNQYSQNVKEIKVEFTTNRNIFDSVFEKFITKLSLQQKSSFTLKDYLSQIFLHDVLACESVESFKQKIAYRNTQAYNNLIEIFSSELNFEIYKLLIQMSLRDIEKYKILKVLYDHKELENSSFGQRCTAAIVILLSLGNNPIIIDEPEAHLDSSLIANYLVELIKQQKQQRQIIFATHNANFVLNADAELIIKLENTDGLTSSVSFAIENLNHREDLLKLEGGREAFKKREQKYNI